MTKPRIKRIPSPAGNWIWCVFVDGRIVAGFNNFRFMCRDLSDHFEHYGRPW